jgi:hypothetical protein
MEFRQERIFKKRIDLFLRHVNKGNRDGSEVVQVYVGKPIRKLKELKRVKRVSEN